MKPIKPRSLQVGDTIGLVTPSSSIMPRRLASGIAYLEQKGFKIKVGKHVSKAERFLAGSDEERAEDIISFFKDPEVQAIILEKGVEAIASKPRALKMLDFSEFFRESSSHHYGERKN